MRFYYSLSCGYIPKIVTFCILCSNVHLNERPKGVIRKKKAQEFDEMNIATLRTHEVFIKLLSLLGQISLVHLLVSHFGRNSYLI